MNYRIAKVTKRNFNFAVVFETDIGGIKCYYWCLFKLIFCYGICGAVILRYVISFI